MISDILGFSMEAHGAPVGTLWGHMGPMGTHGDPWEPMGTHVDPWGPMGTHGKAGLSWPGSLDTF